MSGLGMDKKWMGIPARWMLRDDEAVLLAHDRGITFER